MDLFEQPNEQKEFLEDGSIIINLKSNSKYKITINRNIIKVEQLGALNKLNRGLVGEKLYNLDTVTGTQIKEPGMTTGYFAIQTPGNTDLKGGVMKAVKDEDSILFTQKESDLIHQIKEYIEYYLIHKEPPARVTQPATAIEDFTFEIPKETVFETAEPKPTKKKKKKDPRGCAIGCLSVIVIFLLILFGSYACSRGGSDTTTQDQTTQVQQDNSALIEDYIRKANTFYAESGANIQAFSQLTNADNYEENRQNLMNLTSDLESRVKAELNQIPEDTTDPGLQLARQALEIDDNICLSLYATLATNDPSGAELITQYVEQYNALKPQLDQYLNN